MIYQCHHLEKWANANIDLVEEVLEKNKKAVVVLAGASSSGKSYCARVLKQALEYSGHKALVISLDNYNVGLSGIIPNKVNVNYFDGKINNIKQIIARIKDIIYNVDFTKKYSDEVLINIKDNIKDLLSKEDLDKFIDALSKEWAMLNFDEPTVYDMEEASKDIKVLLSGGNINSKTYSKVVSERVPSNEIISGSDYDVYIVEGIYALTHYFLDGLKDIDAIKNFIDGNPKSLYLRRIIRDAKATSASSAFTTKNYFKYIIPSYHEYILPSSKNADIIFNNDMTFSEMRCGDLFDERLELKTNSKEVFDYLLNNSKLIDKAYQRDTYLVVDGEDAKNNNILRLRMKSFDEGKTYVPFSLVHKGAIKVRKDSRVIRPVNLLIKEDDFKKIWNNYIQCIDDFYRAGFKVGKINHRVRYDIIYKGQKLKISNIENSRYCIVFDDLINEEVVSEINEMINKL